MRGSHGLADYVWIWEATQYWDHPLSLQFMIALCLSSFWKVQQWRAFPGIRSYMWNWHFSLFKVDKYFLSLFFLFFYIPSPFPRTVHLCLLRDFHFRIDILSVHTISIDMKPNLFESYIYAFCIKWQQNFVISTDFQMNVATKLKANQNRSTAILAETNIPGLQCHLQSIKVQHLERLSTCYFTYISFSLSFFPFFGWRAKYILSESYCSDSSRHRGTGSAPDWHGNHKTSSYLIQRITTHNVKFIKTRNRNLIITLLLVIKIQLELPPLCHVLIAFEHGSGYSAPNKETLPIKIGSFPFQARNTNHE